VYAHACRITLAMPEDPKWLISTKKEQKNSPECIEVAGITWATINRSSNILEEACRKINSSNNKQTIQ